MATNDTSKPRAPRRAAATKKPAANASSRARAAKAKVTENVAERIEAGTSQAADLEQKLRAKADNIRAEATRKAGEIGDQVNKLAAEAGDRAREMARQGKTKAAGGLETLAHTIEDSAATVDEKLGKQYGDFARSAASSVAGLAGKLDQQDIDELVEQTREFIKKSPAVAIGSAAVVGFMLARLLRGSDRS